MANGHGKMEKSKSANVQIQKLAIHFEFGHSLILAIRWSGPLLDLTSRNSKTYKSYCNYGVVGVTCGNIPSQKHSLVLVSKLFMLVLLKLCANSFQEAFILVELNKKIRPTVSCLVWLKTVHFRADRPLSREPLWTQLRFKSTGDELFYLEKPVKEDKSRA